MTSLNPTTEDFVNMPRLGVFATASYAAYPAPRPIWYEWNGSEVSMFSAAAAPKIKQLRVDPRATLLIANTAEEEERWVAFEGGVELQRHGVLEVVSRLVDRYWGPHLTETQRDTVKSWQANADRLIGITLLPARIRIGPG